MESRVDGGLTWRSHGFRVVIGSSPGTHGSPEATFYVRTVATKVTVCVWRAEPAFTRTNFSCLQRCLVTVFVRADVFELKVAFFVQHGRVFPGVTFYVQRQSGMRPDVVRGFEAANGNGFCARFYVLVRAEPAQGHHFHSFEAPRQRRLPWKRSAMVTFFVQFRGLAFLRSLRPGAGNGFCADCRRQSR